MCAELVVKSMIELGVFIDGSLQMMQFLEDRVDGPFQVELRAVFSIEGRACLGGVVGEI